MDLRKVVSAQSDHCDVCASDFSNLDEVAFDQGIDRLHVICRRGQRQSRSVSAERGLHLTMIAGVSAGHKLPGESAVGEGKMWSPFAILTGKEDKHKGKPLPGAPADMMHALTTNGHLTEDLHDARVSDWIVSEVNKIRGDAEQNGDHDASYLESPCASAAAADEAAPAEPAPAPAEHLDSPSAMLLGENPHDAMPSICHGGETERAALKADFGKFSKLWLALRIDWVAEFPELQKLGKPNAKLDLINDLLPLDMGPLHKKLVRSLWLHYFHKVKAVRIQHLKQLGSVRWHPRHVHAVLPKLP